MDEGRRQRILTDRQEEEGDREARHAAETACNESQEAANVRELVLSWACETLTVPIAAIRHGQPRQYQYAIFAIVGAPLTESAK